MTAVLLELQVEVSGFLGTEKLRKSSERLHHFLPSTSTILYYVVSNAKLSLLSKIV